MISPVVMACALLIAAGYDPDATFCAFTPAGMASLTGRVGVLAARHVSGLEPVGRRGRA